MIKPPPQGQSTPSPAGSEDDTPVPAAGEGDTQVAEPAATIGRELKSLYDRVVTEPVPDRFRELLDELERKSGRS
jgi:hypothetical protein